VTPLPSPTPKVSVIIPAYNAARTAAASIDSVLAQTHANLEVIVVDDASTDATAAVLEPYERAGRIRVIRHASNLGQTRGRNSALDVYTGEFLAFLDADDLWKPDYIETALRLFELDPSIGVVLFNFLVVDMDTGVTKGDWFSQRRRALAMLTTTPLGTDGQRVQNRITAALVLENFAHLQATIARREVVGDIRFDERLRVAEDLDWVFRIALEPGRGFALCDRISGIYHRHRGTLTTRSEQVSERITQAECLLFGEYLGRPELVPAERRALRERMRGFHVELCYYARRRGDFAAAARHLKASAKLGLSLALLRESAKLALHAIAAKLGRQKPRNQA
jgi:succinoglycan biosynthesis protein ExoO